MEDEIGSQLEMARCQAFDMAIEKKLGTSISLPEKEEELSECQHMGDVGDGTEILETDDEGYDAMVNSEVILLHQDCQPYTVVLVRHRRPDGSTIGQWDNNPPMNTAVYDVRFPDGAIKQYAANIIIENLYAPADAWWQVIWYELPKPPQVLHDSFRISIL